MEAIYCDAQETVGPKYRHVYEKFRTSLRDGRYKVGNRLPAQLDLAKEFSVSLLTVRQALGLLEKDGIISSEQGRGTYIKNIEPTQELVAEIEHKYAFKNIIYLLVDHPSEAPFYKNQLRAIESELVKYKANLVFATLSSEQMLTCTYSTSLHPDFASGVIVDGFVEDIHIQFLKNLKLPFVVLGSHPVKQNVLSVRFDLAKAVHLICREYFKRFDHGRLLFFTEPFRLNYSHELYAGYKKACEESHADDRVYLVYDESRDFCVLRSNIERAKADGKPFGLLLHVNMANKVYEIYCELGLSMEEHPIFVIGKAEYVSPDLRRRLNICGLDIDLEISTAIELLFSTIDGKEKFGAELSPQLCIQSDPEWNISLNWTCDKY